MESFKSFVEQQEFVESVLNEFNNPVQNQEQLGMAKPWSAKKPEILQMWQQSRPNTPIYMTPISKGGDGSSYGEDGIRISGSFPFIMSVLSRLKELMAYENPHTKLRLVFRGVTADAGSPRPDKRSFVFYVNAEERGKGKPGRPGEAPTIT